MPRSHNRASAPTSFLSLIALGIVFRLHPEWIKVRLSVVAAELNVRPERLSRLVSRAIRLFEPLVNKLARRGRPPQDEDGSIAERELVITRALLDVATKLLARFNVRSYARALVVGAFQRLQQQHGITQRRFCQALNLPTRTLRDWLSRPSRSPKANPDKPPPPKPKPKPKPKRPPRRGRFAFDVLLPGTQIGADTTDIKAFGTPLKLIAAQDIGGRDQNLFDAIIVDNHESAELVSTVLIQALAGKSGAQAITDQGTPYLAGKTRDTLDQLEVEHAPQREGNPYGKATVERAFRTVKDIAAPLLSITDRIADAIPAARHQVLAQAFVTIVTIALLKAYQHGARAARTALDARGGIDLDELQLQARLSREKARATDTSAILLLEKLHDSYKLGGSRKAFIRCFRSYPLVVLHAADEALHAQLVQTAREPIKSPWRYFGAIVRNLTAKRNRRRQHNGHHARQNAEHDAARKEHVDRIAALRADPVAWLTLALQLLAMQWLPASRKLLAAGEGLGLGYMRAALELIFLQPVCAAGDLIAGVIHTFRVTHTNCANEDRIHEDGVAAIEHILHREIQSLGCTLTCIPTKPSDMLTYTGHKPRPPPSTTC